MLPRPGLEPTVVRAVQGVPAPSVEGAATVGARPRHGRRPSRERPPSGSSAAAGSARQPKPAPTKDELLRDVWGFRSQGRTRTLDSHASRLRRKLDPDGARYVFNCWGVPQRHLFQPIVVPRES
ncbi:MAG: winged helix-turn-helix domain-containing protein [Solirubrobacterales bacterium]